MVPNGMALRYGAPNQDKKEPEAEHVRSGQDLGSRPFGASSA